MTPEERAAFELSLNAMIGNAVQLAIAVFAVYYFGRKAITWFVNRLPSTPPVIMSRSALVPATDSASVSQTDSAPDRQTAPEPALPRSAMLDTCKALRVHGFSREEARTLLKPYGIGLDNNLWAAAEPAKPAEDDDVVLTPYAGRVTRKSYYESEPELKYEPPV
jgi:hypothetical protein